MTDITLSNNFFSNLLKIIKYYEDQTNSQINTSWFIEHYNVPRIIIVGDSLKKFNLLENIIKCPIFSRNINIDNTLLIHFKINTNLDKSIKCQITHNDKIIKINKNLIQEYIKNISLLNNLCNEIIIEINDNELLNFEFYLLPEIVAYPEDKFKEIYKLYEKYLCLDNIIILFVIPATCSNIIKYFPMSLIKKYNKEQYTLICLTISKDFQYENIKDLIIKRINKTTKEYDSYDFAGCVAIVDSSHSNNIELLQNSIIEHKLFKKIIIDNIPKDYCKKLNILIENNITIIKLIKNLDKIYNMLIKTIWLPNTITKLSNNFNNIYYNHNLLNIDINLIYNIKIINSYKLFIVKILISKIKNLTIININNLTTLDNLIINIHKITLLDLYDDNTKNNIINFELYNNNLIDKLKLDKITKKYILCFCDYINNQVNSYINNIEQIIKYEFTENSYLINDLNIIINNYIHNYISTICLVSDFIHLLEQIDIVEINKIKATQKKLSIELLSLNSFTILLNKLI